MSSVARFRIGLRPSGTTRHGETNAAGSDSIKCFPKRLRNVASGWLTVAAGAQEPECTCCVHEDSEHRRTPSGARAVVSSGVFQRNSWGQVLLHAFPKFYRPPTDLGVKS